MLRNLFKSKKSTMLIMRSVIAMIIVATVFMASSCKNNKTNDVSSKTGSDSQTSESDDTNNGEEGDNTGEPGDNPDNPDNPNNPDNPTTNNSKGTTGSKTSSTVNKEVSTSEKDVVFWGWGSTEYYQNYYNKFKVDFKQYNLKASTPNLPFSEISAAWQAGTMPDVLVTESKYKKQMVYSNMVRPMDEYYKKDTAFDINKLNSNVVSDGSSNGKFYFWGDMNAYGLYYNKMHFSKANLSNPPKTWEELLSYATSLSIKTGGVYTQIGMNSLNATGGGNHPVGIERIFAAAYGQQWFDKAGTGVTINNEKTEKAYDYSVSFFDKTIGGQTNMPAGGTISVEKATLSMELSSVNVRISQLLNMQGTQWGLAYIPVPQGYGTQRAVGYSAMGYCLPLKSKNPQGGWSWVRWYFTNGLILGEKIKWDTDPKKFTPYINTYAPTKEAVDKLYTKDLSNADGKAMLAVRDDMMTKVTMIEDPIVAVNFEETYESYHNAIRGKTKSVREGLSGMEAAVKKTMDDWVKENK